VCGIENPQGLHVPFTRDGDSGSRASYTARPEHVGWPNLLHGGVTTSGRPSKTSARSSDSVTVTLALPPLK